MLSILLIVIAVSYTHSTIELETNSLDEICISLVYILDSIYAFVPLSTFPGPFQPIYKLKASYHLGALKRNLYSKQTSSPEI